MTITAVFETFEELKTFAENILSTGPIKESVCSVEVDKPHETAPAPAVRNPAPQAAPAVTQTAPPIQQQATAQASVQQAEKKEMTYTLVDVRKRLSELSKSGKKEQVQKLIASFGVEKLSQLSEDKYLELMEKAGEI